MSRMRRIVFSSLLVGVLLLGGAVPAFASNVCPVIGGPNNPSIKGTPATVPDMSGNPAHGTDPGEAQPGDVFWN